MTDTKAVAASMFSYPTLTSTSVRVTCVVHSVDTTTNLSANDAVSFTTTTTLATYQSAADAFISAQVYPMIQALTNASVIELRYVIGIGVDAADSSLSLEKFQAEDLVASTDDATSLGTALKGYIRKALGIELNPNQGVGY